MTGPDQRDTERAIDVGMLRRHPIRPTPDVLQNARAPKERSRKGRVEIDRTEYALLRRIAGMAVAFYPVIEQTSVPVTRPQEFNELRLVLQQYVDTRSVPDSEAETIVGLTRLLNALS